MAVVYGLIELSGAKLPPLKLLEQVEGRFLTL